MKRMIIILTIVVAVVFVVSIVVWVRNSSNNREYTGTSDIEGLTDMDKVSIQEITIHNPSEYYTITDQDDIQLLFTVLQSMKLRSKSNSNKEGFAFLLDIKINNDKKINMSILSKDIRINGQNYEPDKDYCDIIRKIYNKLSKKYEINLA